ncbi:uncharacterized protein [Leptinotarsa decemlineata]|uniref:uncharacterized protein n=1 Tax=Leptinotarsa decemlineata TaxID=7539 RepID=UPI003D308D9C
MDTIHNNALRIISGAFITSPVDSLLCELGELPLNLRRHELTLSYTARRQAHQTRQPFIVPVTPTTKANIPFHERKMVSLNLKQMQEFPQIQSKLSKRTPAWRIPLPNINTQLLSMSKATTNPQLIQADYQTIMSQYPLHQKIFTDASKTICGVGCAFVTNETACKFSLHESATILTGGLYAIYKGLSFIKTAPGKEFLIIKDSLNSLIFLSKIYTHHVLVNMIKEEMNQLDNRKVTLLWVPSHIGISGNDIADKLAREAVEYPACNLSVKALLMDLKSYFHCKIVEMWNYHWSQEPSKLKEIKATLYPWNNKATNRFHQVIITRLRLGHTRLTHEYLLRKEPPPKCFTCEVLVIVKHVLEECPLFTVERLNNKIPSKLNIFYMFAANSYG